MAKHIFVTGGVVSSLGKGLTAASLGLLLERMGLRIAMQKLDPYINVDPGTMSPFQHGEVYVTEDGTEADLDLGHYERFTGARIDARSNYTTGKIYSSVIAKERRGEYLGSTVQVVPHITNEIKDAIRSAARPDVDVVITEIGGTVGDIESLPFLEAIRQFGLDVGRENVLYIHLTLIPFLHASQEIKTKPTQHSVGKLREIGIMADVLICRTEVPLAPSVREKLSLFCCVAKDSVIEEKDVDHSIYEIPVLLQQQGVDELIRRRLNLKGVPANISEWKSMLERAIHPKRDVEIAVVGKYLEVQDAYKSIWESLSHAGIANDARVKIRRVNAEDVEKRRPGLLDDVHGILVPGGFGHRGIEGKIQAVEYARVNRIPYYGLCLGMQCATIEFARNVLGLAGANSREFDEKSPHPVIDLMESQKQVVEKGGTMRLGAYPCRLEPGSKAMAAYGREEIRERHRHRFEFNGSYRDAFERAGMRVSGVCPANGLVEIMELKDHPWFVGVQFHPEFQSKPTAAHPLFRDFIRAALEYKMKPAPGNSQPVPAVKG